MSEPVHQHPDDNAFRPVLIGTIVWALAGLVILVLQIGEPWWVITCVVAVVCGIGGIVYLRWRRWRLMRAGLIRSDRGR